jgi:hypothetical protein
VPTNQALQVFYGTLPLIVIVVSVWFREQLLLKDILARLGRIEEFMLKAEARLAALEARAGIIYHG